MNRFVLLLVSFVAVFFGRFLGSEGTAIMTPLEILLFLFVLLVSLLVTFRILLSRKRKKSLLLLFLISFVFCLFFFLLRFFLFDLILASLGMSTGWMILQVSSGSNASSGNLGGESSLPQLESSSSSESLATFRNIIAADFEHDIYQRIRNLESAQFYNLPPQTRPGEYESIVRDHFNQAINVEHLREAMDIEYNEILILEKKAFLQERLFSLLISEEKIKTILELSPYKNIRAEAWQFVENQVEPLSDLRSASERRQMNNLLSSFLASIDRHGRASPTYKGFYSHFIDEEFRRLYGLPLP